MTLIAPRTRGATPQAASATSAHENPSDTSVAPQQGRMARLIRGKVEDPAWARPSLWTLLAGTALLYLWNLSNSGYANEFYAAAVKSGTKSWVAWLFGSLDSSNSITVDKPPAAMWVMVLSARIFGFSSFSMLLPEALMGIGTVALTYGAVRRWSGHGTGLFAGLLVALTPVAALMFRFNNPDAMLVFCMTAAAYMVVRATESERGKTALKWLVGAGVIIGLAFLTKMMQGLLVLPGMALAYVMAARFNLKTRLLHLLAALGGVIVGAGWLVALVSLWPTGSRPYIGGSTNNSLWELALGYNGLGRVLGGQGNGGGGGMGGNQSSGFGGSTGILRMFNNAFGTEISWLLPAALILLVAGLVARGKRPRTDKVRASLALWGGWLIVTDLCMSYMQGTIHPYYVVALVPAVAACVAVGGREALARQNQLGWRALTGVTICVTAIWGFRLLSTTASGWMPWLKWVSVVLGVVGAMVYVAMHAWPEQKMRRLATAGLIVGILGALGGTSAWSVATAAQGHSGSIPTSGPASASTGGMGGGMGAGMKAGSAPGAQGGQGASQAAGSKAGGASAAGGSTGAAASGSKPGTAPSGGAPTGVKPSGAKPSGAAPSGSAGTQNGTSAASSSSKSGTQAAQGATTQAAGSANAQGTSSAAQSGMGGGSSSNAALVKLLNGTNSKWSAAVIGDQSAAGYILSSDTAVMSIGGWSGSDNNVTLTQFEQYVKSGDIHYFIAGGGMGGGQSSGSSAQITAWVKAHFKATTVGGVTVYDLTKSA